MYNNLSKILGEKLLKISDIHRETGLSKTTLTSFYYQRSMDIKLSTLFKICDYLEVSLDELIVYNPQIKGSNKI